MRYGLIMALLGMFMLGFNYSAQAGQWVGVLTGITCVEKAVPCPMAEKGKEEVVLLGEDKAVLHLFGKDQSYLLNHYGHKVRITGDLKEEVGKKTVDVTNFEHLEVVVR